MKISTLLLKNLSYFWRTNLAVILGVAAAVSVLAGALLTGDSVRASLRELALDRLGNTDQVIASESLFREQLAADLQSHPQFNSRYNAAVPLLTLEGVVTHEENKRRASHVQVYGVDERFWQFHGVAVEAKTLGNRKAFISPALAAELGGKADDALLLRIEKPTDIPAETLTGRKDDIGQTIRLNVSEILSAASLGEFSLRPQQGEVRALFVPLRTLQRELKQDGKANTILIDANNAAANADELTKQMLKDVVTLEDLGIKILKVESRSVLSLQKESTLIEDQLAATVQATAAANGISSKGVFSYVVNRIRIGNREIPYSLIAAVSGDYIDESCGISSSASGERIVLNSWAGADLQARCGDKVEIDYFVWKESGGLETKTATFNADYSPGSLEVRDERYLVPDYPGITEADSISDWNPPFPVDLKSIRPKDEEYWKQYRSTPKALILLSKGQELWKSRFGSLTSIQLYSPTEPDLNKFQNTFSQKLRNSLDPLRNGLSVIDVRAAGAQAARGATDFGEYFLYFSFFIVVSALLLTALFFRLGIEQRLREIGLLRAIGFDPARIRSLFLREGFVLALLGSLLGLLGAIGYGWLMMYGLRTWWAGAVGTSSLRLHVSPLSLLIGGIGGVLTALLCIVLSLRSLVAASPRSLLTGSVINSQRFAGSEKTGRINSRWLAIGFGALGALLLVAAIFGGVGQVAGFFGAGFSLLVAALSFAAVRFRNAKAQTIAGSGWWSVARLGFRNASARPGRSVLCIALIASATFIIVAVDAFRKDKSISVTDQRSGTGGFPLLAESLLPLVHNPNTKEGREELVLDATGDVSLDDVKITRLRVRPGDDASCLNLYQPSNPRIIAPSDGFLSAGRFSFQSSLADTPEEKANPWLLLERQSSDETVPVIVDANSMTYVLHKSLGDEIEVSSDSGATIRLRIVAALSDSLLQSELVMSEQNFLRVFPEQAGWKFFLIDAPADKAAAVTSLLEDKLSDYGFDVESTERKLASFHQVENTYLSTFQTLGGLGLLLGTIGLGAVLLRNVLERRRELALLRATGWQAANLALLIVAENILLLLCGLLIGMVCAVIAIAPAVMVRGGQLAIVSQGTLLVIVLTAGLLSSLLAVWIAIRAPLIPALRSE